MTEDELEKELDALKLRIQERVYELLINSKRIPWDDKQPMFSGAVTLPLQIYLEIEEMLDENKYETY